LDKLFREAVSMHCVIEPLRGQVIKSLLLITTESIKGDTMSNGPGLNLSKERGEITALYTRLHGDLARGEQTML
jgi:hypothetical protein